MTLAGHAMPSPVFLRPILLFVVTLAGLALPSRVAAFEPPPPVFARSWIVVDADRITVLGASNADERRPVASTQKLMTALLVVEQGGLNKTVTVDASDVAVAPSRVGIKSGQRYTRLELLRGMLVKSGNDLAHCLGRTHSGSEQSFAARMTQRAHELRMSSTQFRNASGLPDPEQYSTARDMARLALYIYRNGMVPGMPSSPASNINTIILGITQLPSTPFRFSDGRSITLTSTNKLIPRVPGCVGMKTGFTNASGRCLVSAVHRDGRNIIAVTLGSNSKYVWDDSQKLLEWGLRQ